MGRRYRHRRRYRSGPYTEAEAKDELLLAIVAGIFLIPFTLGLSLLVIPLVALKGALFAERRPPGLRCIPRGRKR
jgi:hypothetical protein